MSQESTVMWLGIDGQAGQGAGCGIWGGRRHLAAVEPGAGGAILRDGHCL